MKIAFRHHPGRFMNALSGGLHERLGGRELLSWNAGYPAPATDFDVVLLAGTMSRDEMAAQSKLALIQTTSAGYDDLDVDAATELGIWVANAPAARTGNAVSVAEHAVLLVLGASRHLNEALAFVRDHSVTLHEPYQSLFGKSVCIVGLGGIGQEVADRLRPFGMRMFATDEHPDHAPDDVTCYPIDRLESAIAKVDYVVLCIPGTKENENLIDAKMLGAMKRGSIVVNIARGTLVDEDALAAAISSGHIAAAGLDVLKVEPANPNNPLLALPQVFVTPHIAGPTDVMLAGTLDYIEGAIAGFAEGLRPKSTLNDPPQPRLPLRPSH